MKKANVKVLHETESGLNDRLEINGVKMTNTQAYNAAKKGNIPGYNAVNNNGTKYIRSNRDSTSKNNLN